MVPILQVWCLHVCMCFLWWPESPNHPVEGGCSRVGSSGITGFLPRYSPMVIYQTLIPPPTALHAVSQTSKPSLLRCTQSSCFPGFACRSQMPLLLHSASWLCWDHSEYPDPWRTPGKFSQFWLRLWTKWGLVAPHLCILLTFTVLCLLDPYLKLSSNIAWDCWFHPCRNCVQAITVSLALKYHTWR